MDLLWRRRRRRCPQLAARQTTGWSRGDQQTSTCLFLFGRQTKNSFLFLWNFREQSFDATCSRKNFFFNLVSMKKNGSDCLGAAWRRLYSDNLLLSKVCCRILTFSAVAATRCQSAPKEKKRFFGKMSANVGEAQPSPRFRTGSICQPRGD